MQRIVTKTSSHVSVLPAAETPALPGSLQYALQLNPSSSLDRLLYHYSHTVAGDFLALLDLVCRLGVRLCTAPELPPTTAKRLKVDRHAEDSQYGGLNH